MGCGLVPELAGASAVELTALVWVILGVGTAAAGFTAPVSLATTAAMAWDRLSAKLAADLCSASPAAVNALAKAVMLSPARSALCSSSDEVALSSTCGWVAAGDGVAAAAGEGLVGWAAGGMLDLSLA